jgi:ribose transport system substrate-binding protein
LLAVACCGVAAVAGCGSSSDESSSASGGGSATKASSNSAPAVDQAQRNVDTYYANTSVGPPTTGPAAVKGKSVAVIDAGLSTPVGAEGARAAKEAGKHLGLLHERVTVSVRPPGWRLRS